MTEFDRLQEDMESLDFTGKLKFALKLLEAKEISENEAYQLLTAEGEPKANKEPESLGICTVIEFFS